MRKNMVRALVLPTAAAAALAFTACGDKKAEETTAKQESSVETKAGESMKDETKKDETKAGESMKGETKAEESKKDEKAMDAKEGTLVGTLDEVKDFSFTVTDEKGTSYMFSFEQGKAPEGLSDVKAGDKVTVTYTGTLSEVDPFDGTIVSVKKA